MSKRSISAGSEEKKMKKPKHWSLGLIESMKNPNEIYKETERIVVIKDKYPKSKIHYLMLPREDISSIHKLNKEHVSLLEEFGNLLEDIREENNGITLNAGFHAVPSMQQLHMHIISTDMISPCLKTKIHWNSFNTQFFIPYQDLLRELKQNGCIVKLSGDLHKKLMATKIKCNQCSYEPKNMPQLKEHLIKHVQ